MSDPGEDILKQVLKKHISQQRNKDDPLNLSKDEAHVMGKAFEDKEFRDLMADYVTEITDPKHRAEQDEYIRQLEEKNELPTGKDLLRPEPGFVIKFKYIQEKKLLEKQQKSKTATKKDSKSNSQVKGQEKIFVNMVHSKEVKEPCYAKSMRVENGKSGRNWSVPYTFGPMRMEADNKKSLVPTFDCCFHPLALIYASKSVPFRDLIAGTVRESLTKHFKTTGEIAIDKDYLVLKGTQYKNGVPPAMMIDNKLQVSHPKKEEIDVCAEPTCTKGKRNVEANEKKQESTFPKGFLLKSNSKEGVETKIEDISNQQIKPRFSQVGGQTEAGETIPFYEIIERGEYDMADKTIIEGLKRPSTRPKYLVIRVKIPGIKSAKRVNLDVSENRLVLDSSQTRPKYKLSLELPYPVISEEGTAKFQKEMHILTIEIPVIRPDMPLVTNASNQKEVAETANSTPAKRTASIDTSPVIVKHEDCTNELNESPVIVDKPSDHTRWINSDSVNFGNVREDFAADGDIPTLNSAAMNKSNEVVVAIASPGHKMNNIDCTLAPQEEFEERSNDDFQIIECNDMMNKQEVENELDNPISNLERSSTEVLSGSDSNHDRSRAPKEPPSYFGKSKLIYELD